MEPPMDAASTPLGNRMAFYHQANRLVSLSNHRRESAVTVTLFKD